MLLLSKAMYNELLVDRDLTVSCAYVEYIEMFYSWSIILDLAPEHYLLLTWYVETELKRS